MSAGASRRFTVNVTDLLRRPGSRKSVHEQVAVHGVAVVDSAVPDGTEVDVELEIESLADGLMVSGRVRAPWEGLCRRCLEPARGRLDVPVQELFQDPARKVDEEAFDLEGDVVDLVPLVVDALMLELPLAPLCRPDCAGLCATCGVDLNEAGPDHHHEVLDPRWAALSELRLDEDPPPG